MFGHLTEMDLPGNWNDPGQFKMYNINENKAMLGVTTDEAENGVEIQVSYRRERCGKIRIEER